MGCRRWAEQTAHHTLLQMTSIRWRCVQERNFTLGSDNTIKLTNASIWYESLKNDNMPKYIRFFILRIKCCCFFGSMTWTLPPLPCYDSHISKLLQDFNFSSQQHNKAYAFIDDEGKVVCIRAKAFKSFGKQRAKKSHKGYGCCKEQGYVVGVLFSFVHLCEIDMESSSLMQIWWHVWLCVFQVIVWISL